MAIGMEVRAATTAELASLDLNARAFGLLLALAEFDSLSQREIGRLRRMDRTTTLAETDKLCAAGLVKRKNTSNGRTVALTLTAQGRKLLSRAERRARAVERQFVSPLTKQEKELLYSGIDKIFDLLPPFRP